MPIDSVKEVLLKSLRSAFVITRDTNFPDQIDLFGNVVSQPLPGSERFSIAPYDDGPKTCDFITRVHSNLARPGSAGLPHGQEFFVSSWRAVTQILTESLLDWASDVEVEFIYNYKCYASEPLSELLHGTCFIGIDSKADDVNAARLAEFSYKQGVYLPVWMRPHMSFQLNLKGLNNPGLDRLKTQLADEKRRLTVWLYLDGVYKREIT